MQNPKVVLLGGPNSGKTHYAGQLYGRLQRNPGTLRLRKEEGAPTDLSVLSEVLRCLEDGNAAKHTPVSTWDNIHLPLIDTAGRKFDLKWPDYGGEQLSQVFKSRSVSQNWQEKLVTAEGWILLIRPNAEVTFQDALEKLSATPVERDAEKDGLNRSIDWDANAFWVEKLQILLHVAKLGTVNPLRTPRLAILLSCYDELDNNDLSPMEELEQKLPLVASFIRSNWESDSVSVWGLSALGQTLHEHSHADAFVDEGPEHQGWVVPPEGGSRSSDLSLPIMWLLNGMTA